MALAIYSEDKSPQKQLPQPRIHRHHLQPNFPPRPSLLKLTNGSSLPTQFPPMEHIAPPILTTHHSSLSLSPRWSSLTLPGASMTAQIDVADQCSPGVSDTNLPSP